MTNRKWRIADSALEYALSIGPPYRCCQLTPIESAGSLVEHCTLLLSAICHHHEMVLLLLFGISA
jgi:hypothetical protein